MLHLHRHRMPMRCLAVVVMVTMAGCIGQAAKQATDELSERLSKLDTRNLAEQTSRAAVSGLTDELAKPEHQRVIDDTIHTVSASAVRGLTDGIRDADVERFVDRAVATATTSLARRLENDANLRANVHEIGAAAVAGVRDELGAVFPDCATVDRQHCIERHITQLSRAAASGVTAGIVDAARLPLLLVTFAAGASFAMLLALLITHRRSASRTAASVVMRPTTP